MCLIFEYQIFFKYYYIYVIMIEVETIRGDKMKREGLNYLDTLAKKIFKDERGTKQLLPEFFEFYKSDIFFLVKNNNTIVSCGRLRNVEIEIEIDKIRFNLFGIADIISVARDMGYGKILIQAIIEYLKNNGNITAIGFCKSSNSNFYLKCGLEILEGFVKYFKYKNGDNLIFNNDDNDVIFYRGDDEIIKKLLQSSNNIIIYRPFW